ncbi:ABC transporter ATP-binding protein [Sinirhodobacter populi]|uniref:ABC transporter ATP-binding protein n=1 Tax=Paenirhodobacter populi TaxID=2306993 RepID=A0A443KGH8_9RHOB|nr:ATP-binding cassette domain-containing protein [Sinirhodobacter populi]RWR31871.1 ABC transporter ATP-binding protein [Sinirhodobacter populi]
MIHVENLCLYHGERPILNDVCFSVAVGETLAIVGESGGGKTSLARLLLGLLDGRYTTSFASHRGFHWSGRALLGQLDVLRAGKSEMDNIRGRKVGMIVQALSDALNPHLTVRQHLREVLILRGRRPLDVEKACDDWNIPERLRDRYPAGLSGGEIQRVLTALAMLPCPRYLILDEPTASLDRQNRAKAIRALNKDRASRCQLLITHDLDLAGQLADRVAVLREGRIVEAGTTQNVLREPSKHYTASLIDAARECGRACGPARPRAVTSSTKSGLEMHASRSPECLQCGLSVRSLMHSYGGVPVLKNLSFHLPKGSCLAVLGESGSGKSTLARILSGYEPLQSGQISWISQNGLGRAVHSAQIRAVLVSQHPHRAMARHFTVSEVLEEVLKLTVSRNTEASIRCNRHTDSQCQISNLLNMVGLPIESGFLSRPTAALSGGEAQRLVIARALASKPDCIVADEPTAALDMLSRSIVLKLLKKLRDEQALTIVLVTHEPEIASYMSNDILHLSLPRSS